MIGQKLVRILQTLDAAAFRRLGNAFRSPYFTSSPLLLQLYELLKKEYPDFDTSRLNKEQVFRKLYPDKPFNDGLLRTLVRDFTRISEDFVLFESVKNDESRRRLYLTQWLGENNLYDEFKKETQALLDKINAEPYRDVEYFSDCAQLYAAWYFHPLTEKHTLDDQTLTRLMDCIDQRYILFKLRLASEMKNREHIVSKQYRMRLLDEALEAGTAGLLQGNAPFDLFRTLFDLYEPEKAPAAFQTLKAQLASQMAQLRYFDKSMLLTQLTNYAVRQLNKGNRAFNKEIFQLHRLALEQKMVLANGKLEAGVFRNIVLSGCMEKEFQWTEQFIQNYEQYLDADNRQDEKTMALALLCFHNEDYDKAIDWIIQHRFSNVLLQMNTRVILIKAWFEKFFRDFHYYDHLIYQIDSLEKFIRRNTVISQQIKDDNLSFLLATKQLAEHICNKKPAPYTRSRLGKYFHANRRMQSKEWLMHKLEQYQNEPPNRRS